MSCNSQRIKYCRNVVVFVDRLEWHTRSEQLISGMQSENMEFQKGGVVGGCKNGLCYKELIKWWKEETGMKVRWIFSNHYGVQKWELILKT